MGKTTVSLGLLSMLKKKYNNIGYIKPIGQEHVEVEEGISVDKDVVLCKEHFDIQAPYPLMSPVIVPRGFTQDFLDGKIETESLREAIAYSYGELAERHDAMVLEGTGHVGVGSIFQLDNAMVAAMLGAPVVMIASGGIGSSFDALMLNLTLCEKRGAKVIGVILNRVLPEKKDDILHYMGKALQTVNLPILGCIPFDSFLSNPSMKDFESLFETTLLTGSEHRLRHYRHTRLVATSVDIYRDLIAKNQLIITPSGREDIILATLTKHWDLKITHPEEDLMAGMILTGDHPPKASIVEQIKKAAIPMLYVPLNSYDAMQKILSFTAKLQKEDVEKTREAIEVVEKNLFIDSLWDRLDQ